MHYLLGKYWLFLCFFSKLSLGQIFAKIKNLANREIRKLNFR